MENLKTEYIGLEQINGPLVYIKTPQELSFDEQVELILENGEKRITILLNDEGNIEEEEFKTE